MPALAYISDSVPVVVTPAQLRVALEPVIRRVVADALRPEWIPLRDTYQLLGCKRTKFDKDFRHQCRLKKFPNGWRVWRKDVQALVDSFNQGGSDHE